MSSNNTDVMARRELDRALARDGGDSRTRENDRQSVNRMKRKLRAVSGLASLCSRSRLQATEVLGHMEPPEWYDFDSEQGLIDFAIDAGAAIQMVLDERGAIFGAVGSAAPAQAPPSSASRLPLKRRLQYAI